MSEGKASSYRVVSAEELKRRALAAARGRLDRANAEARELAAQVAAANETYGSSATAPQTRASSSDDPSMIDNLADHLEAEVAVARQQVHEVVSAARSVTMTQAVIDLLSSIEQTESVPELSHRKPDPDPSLSTQLNDALRVIQRLPGETSPEAVARCEQLLAAIASAESEARSEVLLTALRAEVQNARDRSELISHNREEIGRLYGQLDGLDSEEASGLRGYLRGIPLDVPLEAELARRVAHAREDAVREQDRRFALEVTRDVLQQQGYAIGEDFVTIVASTEGALVPLAASRRHGIRVRERTGQLLFNLVRFDGSGEGPDDVEAATAFCSDFETISRRATESGLSLTRLKHFAPGDGRVEVRNGDSPFTADESTAVTEDDARERRRS